MNRTIPPIPLPACELELSHQPERIAALAQADVDRDRRAAAHAAMRRGAGWARAGTGPAGSEGGPRVVIALMVPLPGPTPP